jgi:hypothetical protein
VTLDKKKENPVENVHALEQAPALVMNLSDILVTYTNYHNGVDHCLRDCQHWIFPTRGQEFISLLEYR